MIRPYSDSIPSNGRKEILRNDEEKWWSSWENLQSLVLCGAKRLFRKFV
jgi:hypothetical protein